MPCLGLSAYSLRVHESLPRQRMFSAEDDTLEGTVRSALLQLFSHQLLEVGIAVAHRPAAADLASLAQ